VPVCKKFSPSPSQNKQQQDFPFSFKNILKLIGIFEGCQYAHHYPHDAFSSSIKIPELF